MFGKYGFKIFVILTILLFTSVWAYTQSNRTGNSETVRKPTSPNPFDSILNDSTPNPPTKSEKPKDSMLDKTAKFKVKVHVSVTCDDNTTKAMIESHIKRELRSLGDVELVDKKDAEYTINLIAVPHKFEQSGKSIGTTSMAVMYINKMSHDVIMGLGIRGYVDLLRQDPSVELPTRMNPVNSNDISEVVKRYYKNRIPDLFTYPSVNLITNIKDNDLPNTCKEIVAMFDVEALERERQAYYEAQEFLQEMFKDK